MCSALSGNNLCYRLHLYYRYLWHIEQLRLTSQVVKQPKHPLYIHGKKVARESQAAWNLSTTVSTVVIAQLHVPCRLD